MYLEIIFRMSGVAVGVYGLCLAAGVGFTDGYRIRNRLIIGIGILAAGLFLLLRDY